MNGAPIRKAVFPVAGLGTRFLPATKASPKEMLPIVDKPIIQCGVEEAIEAGITDLIFITGRTKRAIEDHFDTSAELERELEERGREKMLEEVRNLLPAGVTCVYIRQAHPLGLGHAVLCAEPAVGAEPFAVILPDDLIHSSGPGCIKQMADVFAQRQSSLVAVQNVAPEDTDKYGIVSSPNPDDKVSEVEAIVEKPAPAEAPSTLGVVGRYVLTASVFDELRATGRGAGGEIQLTDGIASLLKKQAVGAYRFDGERYDCGSKLGFLQATVQLGLEHPELGPDFKSYLQQLDLS